MCELCGASREMYELKEDVWGCPICTYSNPIECSECMMCSHIPEAEVVCQFVGSPHRFQADDDKVFISEKGNDGLEEVVEAIAKLNETEEGIERARWIALNQEQIKRQPNLYLEHINRCLLLGDYWDLFPNEVWLEIIGKVKDPKDLYHLALSHDKMYGLLANKEYWLSRGGCHFFYKLYFPHTSLQDLANHLHSQALHTLDPLDELLTEESDKMDEKMLDDVVQYGCIRVRLEAEELEMVTAMEREMDEYLKAKNVLQKKGKVYDTKRDRGYRNFPDEYELMVSRPSYPNSFPYYHSKKDAKQIALYYHLLMSKIHYLIITSLVRACGGDDSKVMELFDFHVRPEDVYYYRKVLRGEMEVKAYKGSIDKPIKRPNWGYSSVYTYHLEEFGKGRNRFDVNDRILDCGMGSVVHLRGYQSFEGPTPVEGTLSSVPNPFSLFAMQHRYQYFYDPLQEVNVSDYCEEEDMLFIPGSALATLLRRLGCNRMVSIPPIRLGNFIYDIRGLGNYSVDLELKDEDGYLLWNKISLSLMGGVHRSAVLLIHNHRAPRDIAFRTGFALAFDYHCRKNIPLVEEQFTAMEKANLRRLLVRRVKYGEEEGRDRWRQMIASLGPPSIVYDAPFLSIQNEANGNFTEIPIGELVEFPDYEPLVYVFEDVVFLPEVLQREEVFTSEEMRYNRRLRYLSRSARYAGFCASAIAISPILLASFVVTRIHRATSGYDE